MPQPFDRAPHGDINPFRLTLRDGTPVLLRPVIPEDRERIQKGMVALSRESRYFRFFTTAARLSDQQLHYFSEVDHQNHVAWVTLDLSHPKHPGLGIARFVLTKEEPTVAEMAFVVIDAYQHQGLGTILLAVLYLMAEARGVRVLRSILIGENTSVSNWLRNLGATESYEGGEYRLDLMVRRDRTLLPRTPSGTNLLRLAQ